jgi:putative FmdB family regulatory protein
LPIYQYKCEDCSCEFDLRKSFTDESNHITCPECGKKAKRMFIPTAIIFKGSGFYVTDYKANSTLPSGDTGKTEKVKKDIAEVTKPDKKGTEIP